MASSSSYSRAKWGGQCTGTFVREHHQQGQSRVKIIYEGLLRTKAEVSKTAHEQLNSEIRDNAPLCYLPTWFSIKGQGYASSNKLGGWRDYQDRLSKQNKQRGR